MASGVPGHQQRGLLLGLGPVEKASGAITSDPTINLFTIAGGEVLITALWVKVTTSITTNGGTLAIHNDPTTGDTIVLVTATDLGTGDSTAGTVLGLTQGTTAASAFLEGGRIDLNVVATTGTIDLVGASSVNGAVTVYATFVPLTLGATMVAA